MSNEQPEALMLADLIKESRYEVTPFYAACIEDELRRLHEVNQELVGALEHYADIVETYGCAAVLARHLLAKAKGESNE